VQAVLSGALVFLAGFAERFFGVSDIAIKFLVWRL
jgi:hypothetical protein